MLNSFARAAGYPAKAERHAASGGFPASEAGFVIPYQNDVCEIAAIMLNIITARTTIFNSQCFGIFLHFRTHSSVTKPIDIFIYVFLPAFLSEGINRP
jgi:hypothetical protein